MVEPERICGTCRAEPPAFKACRSLFLYRDAGARIVHALKYEQALWLRRELTLLLQEAAGWEAWFNKAVLVPVPLHPAKHRSRGYNQAELIAKAVQAAFPATRIDNCLRRIRRTPSQTFLSRVQRQRNMRGAFTCSMAPEARRIILVDDVLTTGATLNAAVVALNEAGAGDISAFTLAHG
jgi:ComF family protein